ncbi:MAG TPA: GNAT family N-acetyltransferase, partial [Rhizobiales bacterium]|nr:GNAT family N-acetyltransferase [Hyphomicrobiales bacterium]
MAHRRNNEILARYAVPLERFAGPAPLDGWSRLAANSAFASIVHNPVWLGAMMQHLGTGRKSVHLVRAGNKENPVAIAALSKTGIPHILPGHSVVSTWDCGFMMSGMPLLERGDPEGALVALIEEAQRQTGASAILLRKVPDYPKLAAWLGKNSIATAIFAPHRRAALSCTGSYDDWFEGNFSRKRRKEYRRLRNRLAETGKLQSISLAPGDDIERWVDEFAVLEASGWKGKRGTAVACNPAKVIFLKQAFAALREKNQLRLWKITLDDRP